MPAAPFPDNEAQRIEALHAASLLDTLPEAEFDELVQLASEICGTPVALISLIDRDRQWFKAKVGTDIAETSRESSFCAHAILDPDEMLIVPDARVDERFHDNPLVTGDPNIVFYAGVPLVDEAGFALGTLCVIDVEQKELSPLQTTALKLLARQTLDRLAFRHKLRLLEESNEALIQSNVLIQKFARTVAHDIKNPLTNIHLTSQLIHRNSQGKGDEKTAELADRNLQSCKRLVGLVNEILTYSTSPTKMMATEQDIDLNSLLKRVLALIELPDNFEVSLPGTDPLINSSAIALEQIFLNLFTNAVRYNDKDTVKIQVQFRDEGDHYRFKVSDNGRGIAPEHIDQIFHDRFVVGTMDRFAQQGTGIGLYTVKTLVEKLGGSIYAESIPGQSTSFVFTVRK